MRLLLLLVAVLFGYNANAQIEVLTVLNPKPESKYIVGFGAMLKFGVPVLEKADEINIEVGVKFIPEIEYPDSYGIAYVPVKLGYRYTLDRSGTGFYAEPQLGYSVYGARSYQNMDGADVDEIIKGPISGLSFGYLFPSEKIVQLDLSLRYENVFYKQGSVHTIGLRLSSHFRFKNRDY
ncbi:hypothetical protein ESA94_15525 [Lacibacter luteus]|uniref:Outer membrane protein beta-barrel domain-containing protein n=1 Tax=Lacibacter luteus TaxID=2508719 RepID=A0A4Q1CFQ8_9BACT|nr:hypothetical protein [Lacibacter luteus]RXK58799.1 hypothetical protein ESA94_15525 [Lacibacter luteus]